MVTPVYDPLIKEDLKRVIDFALRDNMQGRCVDGTGRNLPWVTNDPTPFRSQEALYKHYADTLLEAQLKKLRPKRFQQKKASAEKGKEKA